MATTQEIQPGRRIDLAREVVGLDGSDRRARLVPQPGGPPQRIDGFTIGAPHITTSELFHDGEMHPDGDELLCILSGAFTVSLELAAGKVMVDLGAGETVAVPKGVWHQITMREPGQLLHITPGPNGDHRPLPGRV